MKQYIPKEHLVVKKDSSTSSGLRVKLGRKVSSVPFNRGKFSSNSSMHDELIKVRLSSSNRTKLSLINDRKTYSFIGNGFVSSVGAILSLSLAFMLLFALLSPTSDFTFKSVLVLLSNVRFSNNWLAAFQDVISVWKKFDDFNISLPGNGWNIILMFGEFWKFIANCFEFSFNIVKVIFTLFIDFVVNIVEILKFLAALGAKL